MTMTGWIAAKLAEHPARARQGFVLGEDPDDEFTYQGGAPFLLLEQIGAALHEISLL
jgi:hypothetical protein